MAPLASLFVFCIVNNGFSEVLEVTFKSLPSNVKLALSSNLPPVPTVTTLPDVKLATLVTPAIETLSKFV